MSVTQILDLNFVFKDNDEVSEFILSFQKKGYSAFHRDLTASAQQAFGLPLGTVDVVDIFTDHNAFIQDEEDEPNLFPELFFKENCLIAFAPNQKNTRFVIIRKGGEHTPAVDVEADAIASILEKMDGRRIKNWNPRVDTVLPANTILNRRGNSSKFKELNLSAVIYDNEELSGAKLISESAVRGVLLAIAKSGKVKIDDAQRDFSVDEIQKIKDAGLVKTEYLVQCRGNSNTLCTISNKQEMLSGQGLNMKCPHCSKLFKDELIVDIISPSDACRRLLDKSHWMTIWVTDIIVNSGIDKADIHWNACAQSDEIDIIANVGGNKLFFELKDREFGLGDAYPFNYRLNRFGGDYGIVVTADTVSGEASKFFKEQSGDDGVKIRIFDKDSDIYKKLPDFISTLMLNSTSRQITRNFQISAVVLPKLVKAWIVQ
jgi:hypothetical protein